MQKEVLVNTATPTAVTKHSLNMPSVGPAKEYTATNLTDVFKKFTVNLLGTAKEVRFVEFSPELSELVDSDFATSND